MAQVNKQFAHACARFQTRITSQYWLAVGLLTVFNTLLLGATSAVAGIPVDAYVTGAREVVLINVLALTLLVWPTIALMMRGLYNRRKWCCWGAVTHGLAVFVLMEAYFGKPFGLTGGSTIANLAPTIMFTGLTAWLMVEWHASRKYNSVSVS